MFRIGEGYDVHRLVEGRKLILGGVEVPYEKGLLGHSDADVLVHAIMDSMLGAMALGDIGKFFPDSDSQYKNISSMELMRRLVDIINDKINEEDCENKKNKFIINNIDATIICQEPKLRSFIDEMRKNISEVLKLNINQVSIKATTEEGLGFTGNKEGISARAICLVEV